MTAGRLHHALVLTDDLEASRAFYCDLLGFRVVESPPLPFPGVWLALDGEACVHLAERGAYLETLAAMGLAPVDGPLDHVAFRRGDVDALAARLEADGVPVVRNEVPGALRQVFVTDPNGVRVELNAEI